MIKFGNKNAENKRQYNQDVNIINKVATTQAARKSGENMDGAKLLGVVAAGGGLYLGYKKVRNHFRYKKHRDALKKRMEEKEYRKKKKQEDENTSSTEEAFFIEVDAIIEFYISEFG